MSKKLVLVGVCALGMQLYSYGMWAGVGTIAAVLAAPTLKVASEKFAKNFDTWWEKPGMGGAGIQFEELIKRLCDQQEQGGMQEQDDTQAPAPAEHARISRAQALVIILYKAVETDDRSVVKEVLDKGGTVDARDAQERTPLMIASMRGFTSMMLDLITRYAGVNAQDANRESSLIYAARFNRDGAIRILMNYRACITRDRDGHLPSSLTTSIVVKNFLRSYEEHYRSPHRHDRDRANHEEEHYHGRRRDDHRDESEEYHERVRRGHSPEGFEGHREARQHRR